MDTIKSYLSPFATASGPLQDTMKLVVVGSTIETARRASMSAWNHFLGSFCLTAHFTNEDVPYDWIMHWLSKQPAWSRSREFEITTRSTGRRGMTGSSSGELEEDEDEDEPLVHGRRKRSVAFTPSFDTTHTIFYKGHWLWITRGKRSTEWGQAHEIKISVVARNNSIIKQLVLEAKKQYEKDAEHRVHIYMADSFGSWRWNGARPKRPLSSIVLDPAVKQMLLDDCRDFLRSEDWYAERGIPFRRGYLLHGVPGSGKSSLAFAISGELGLDIFALSLSGKGMNDTTLVNLMANIPSRCVLLLEDLDAAFTRSTTRDEKSTGAPTVSTAAQAANEGDGSTLSLSGLLNAIDGISATEGRLLFATTNHIERLDPALSRPGRMDVWVNFTNATRWQAEGIFKCFFPAKPEPGQTETDSDSASVDGPPKRKVVKTEVPFLEPSEIADLAKKFAENIPENELSVASLQGYLLKNKTRPRQCVEEVGAWVIKEREERARLKKEKEEAERKEKEEQAKKDKEAKDKERSARSEERRAKRRAARKATEAVLPPGAVPLPTHLPQPLPTPPTDALPVGLMLTMPMPGMPNSVPMPVAAHPVPIPLPTPTAIPVAAIPPPIASTSAATTAIPVPTSIPAAPDAGDESDSDSDDEASSSEGESGSDESDAATAALVDGATTTSKTIPADIPAAAAPAPTKGKRKWVAVKHPTGSAASLPAATEPVALAPVAAVASETAIVAAAAATQ